MLGSKDRGAETHGALGEAKVPQAHPFLPFEFDLAFFFLLFLW